MKVIWHVLPDSSRETGRKNPGRICKQFLTKGSQKSREVGQPGTGNSAQRERSRRVLGRNGLRQSITSSISQGRALGSHFLVQKSAHSSLSTILKWLSVLRTGSQPNFPVFSVLLLMPYFIHRPLFMSPDILYSSRFLPRLSLVLMTFVNIFPPCSRAIRQ